MHKRFLLIAFISASVLRAGAQSGKIDTVAISILDHMSAIIGDLSACSVSIHDNYDIRSKELGLIKHSDEAKLYLRGPDKLLVTSEGDKGSRKFFYNGKTLSYYSLEKNQYGQIGAPATIMNMIDSMNRNYGIDFPIADFFYPSFVDDLIAESKNLYFLGMTEVGGRECFHIAGTTKNKTYQFWISNDAYYLPMKVVLVYTGKDLSPQFEATLDNWQVNPSLPDALFEFTAPPSAKKVKLAVLALKK